MTGSGECPAYQRSPGPHPTSSVVASSKDNYALKFYNIAGTGDDEDDE